MENNTELVAEVGRINSLLHRNPPLIYGLKETVEVFNSRHEEFAKISFLLPLMPPRVPGSKEMRMEYLRISEVETKLNMQYRIFRTKLDNVLKAYEFVGKALREIDRPASTFGLFTDDQFTKLRRLFEKDLTFVLFKGLSQEIPQLLADEWEQLFLITPLNVCIQEIRALKARMRSEMEVYLSSCGN